MKKIMKGILGIGVVLGMIACGDLSDPETDLTGTESASEAYLSFAPVFDTYINSKPPAQTTQNVATFEFSCSGSGCTYQCKLDKNKWRACASPKSYTRLSNGSHTFRVKAKDALGTTDDTPAVWSWTIKRWLPTSATGAPTGRYTHSAVWTGTEMIVWGGSYYDAGYYYERGDGGRYDPVTDSWTSIPTDAAILARGAHTAVWTDTEMIVWGGVDGAPYLNTGARFNPSTNGWTATTTTNAPTARVYHNAFWTGTEMIIWGGRDNSYNYVNTGARYNPAGNSWTPISLTNAPAARGSAGAVWTDSEMIVWGGYSGSVYLNSGGRYDPASNIWTATSEVNAPAGAESPATAWTGTQMLVWGGKKNVAGGRYTPATNSWKAMSKLDAPSNRLYYRAIWTGKYLVVWGGDAFSSASLKGGGRYDPVKNVWTATSTTGAPQGRCFHRAVWTGTEMIVWGGRYDDPINIYTNLDSGGRYRP